MLEPVYLYVCIYYVCIYLITKDAIAAGFAIRLLPSPEAARIFTVPEGGATPRSLNPLVLAGKKKGLATVMVTTPWTNSVVWILPNPDPEESPNPGTCQ